MYTQTFTSHPLTQFSSSIHWITKSLTASVQTVLQFAVISQEATNNAFRTPSAFGIKAVLLKLVLTSTVASHVPLHARLHRFTPKQLMSPTPTLLHLFKNQGLI